MRNSQLSATVVSEYTAKPLTLRAVSSNRPDNLLPDFGAPLYALPQPSPRNDPHHTPKLPTLTLTRSRSRSRRSPRPNSGPDPAASPDLAPDPDNPSSAPRSALDSNLDPSLDLAPGLGPDLDSVHAFTPHSIHYCTPRPSFSLALTPPLTPFLTLPLTRLLTCTMSTPLIVPPTITYLSTISLPSEGRSRYNNKSISQPYPLGHTLGSWHPASRIWANNNVSSGAQFTHP